jgi:hypothetical protein
MWLQDQKEKSQEKNCKKEKGQEEKEIIHPRMFLAGTPVPQSVLSFNHGVRPISY